MQIEIRNRPTFALVVVFAQFYLSDLDRSVYYVSLSRIGALARQANRIAQKWEQ